MELSGRDLQASRRAVVMGACGMLGKGKRQSRHAAARVSVEYHGGFIYWPSGMARAAVGAGGVRSDKKEGDRATPPGMFALPFGMYREDRIHLPNTALPMIPLREVHAWVDDPNDPKYNQLVELPYPSRTERLWRTDGIYDLLVVVGYNMNPTRPGASSAIFLHIARPNFSPTDGCVAVSRSILLKLVTVLSTESTLTIRE